MSEEIQSSVQQEMRTTVSSLETFRQSPEFTGAVEPIDDHDHANDHFALIYETEEELFTTIVPFIREGLRQGEKCLYVTDERTGDKEMMMDALRNGGVDVDEQIESGALEFTTVQETYLREKPFEPESMLSFYADAVEEAVSEYDGFRVSSGTNWIQEVSFEAFLEYEGRVNKLFEETEAKAVCHYDRNKHSPVVIRDIIKTHPHLISDGTVCHNFYYTPPQELFGSEETENEVNRMLETVRDRAEVKEDLAEHKRFLQELNSITSDPEYSFREKLQEMLDLGCDWFDLDVGGVNRVDTEADTFHVEHVNKDHALFKPGVELPLSETYCKAAAGMKQAVTITEPMREGFDDIRVYEDFGAKAYLGTYIPGNDTVDRTFGFIGTEEREESFTDEDLAYLDLMGQWVKSELDRQQYETELEETVRQLQQSNDRLKQFAYAASHDLQEPLRMVSSYLRLLESKHSENLDEEAQEYIDFAVDGADRMREMVDDLLAYSRVEQSEDVLEPVETEEIVETVTEDLTVCIEESNAEIAVESLPPVEGDADKLEQLFQNLISNAIKYSGEEPPAIEITAQQQGEHWQFAVADSGIGIDPAKTDRIFEVFKRLHHDDEYAGTGIGLALCQEIVENHGGDIWVESEPGEGSTFYFLLPALTED